MNVKTAKLVAIVTGILAVLLAVITPLLPVQQDAASVTWPQNSTLDSVSAPLVTYQPDRKSVV